MQWFGAGGAVDLFAQPVAVAQGLADEVLFGGMAVDQELIAGDGDAVAVGFGFDEVDAVLACECEVGPVVKTEIEGKDKSRSPFVKEAF